MTVRTSSWRRTSAGMLHPRVIGGREQEAEAGLVEQSARVFGGDVDLRAERFEHVGRAAARADAAVAVLGDRQPAGRGDERRRGRDVDQARAVAAGPAAIGITDSRAGRTAAPRRSARARRRSSPRRSRPSSEARSACRRSRPARACRAPAARTDARESSIGRSSPLSSLGSGLGTGFERIVAGARNGSPPARPRRGRKVVIWFMGHLKQKSPPVAGGQSMIGC